MLMVEDFFVLVTSSAKRSRLARGTDGRRLLSWCRVQGVSKVQELLCVFYLASNPRAVVVILANIISQN